MFDHDDYELHEAQKHACRMAKERDEALLRQALEALKAFESLSYFETRAVSGAALAMDAILERLK